MDPVAVGDGGKMGPVGTMRAGRARAGVVLTAVVTILFSGQGLVSADTTRVQDGDDVSTPFDIAWAKHEHDRLDDGRWRIKHTISMHERWSGRLLFPHACGNISIYIDDLGRRIEFYWDGRVKARLGDRELVAWRPDGRSVAVRVPPRLLARGDGTYRWQAAALHSESGRCQEGERAFLDQAPDSRWIRHELS